MSHIVTVMQKERHTTKGDTACEEQDTTICPLPSSTVQGDDSLAIFSTPFTMAHTSIPQISKFSSPLNHLLGSFLLGFFFLRDVVMIYFPIAFQFIPFFTASEIVGILGNTEALFHGLQVNIIGMLWECKRSVGRFNCLLCEDTLFEIGL